MDPKTLLSWVWLDVPGLRSMWSAGELSLRPLCSLFSHAFFHPEWQTLVPNMAALFMFGHRTWRSVGWGGMTALYLSGGIVSGIILAIEGFRLFVCFLLCS